MLEQYIQKLRDKELVYKECQSCDSGMVLLSEVIKIFIEYNNEITKQLINK